MVKEREASVSLFFNIFHDQEAVNTGVSRDEFNELKAMFGELKATIEDVLK